MVQPAPRVRGHVRPPGDKAISHRYALLAALADGRSEIRGYSTGGDCASTLRCLRGLGVSIDETGRDASGLMLTIAGRGLGGLSAPPEVLDAGNSGSTMRMLAGILAAHPFRATMTGDDSLRRRPMRRVIVPLERMGARIGSEDGRPPLVIQGAAPLQPIEFSPEVPSAQVKTAVILAPIRSSGVITRFIGRRRSELSPVIVARNGCAARMPASMRIVLPELPASSIAFGGCRPRICRPRTSS